MNKIINNLQINQMKRNEDSNFTYSKIDENHDQNSKLPSTKDKLTFESKFNLENIDLYARSNVKNKSLLDSPSKSKISTKISQTMIGFSENECDSMCLKKSNAESVKIKLKLTLG
jgi:hypothetical protein